MKYLIVFVAVIAVAFAEVNVDGSYKYSYEGENISGHEEGVGGVSAHGSYKFTSPEGEHFEVSYVADENGFVPTGSHIPTVPDYIVRALEYNRAHPEK